MGLEVQFIELVKPLRSRLNVFGLMVVVLALLKLAPRKGLGIGLISQ